MRIVELAGAGQAHEELAKTLEPTAACIRNRVKQAGRDEGERAVGLTTDEREEFARVRRESRVLREEKEVLIKAPASFG